MVVLIVRFLCEWSEQLSSYYLMECEMYVQHAMCRLDEQRVMRARGTLQLSPCQLRALNDW